MAKQIVQDFLKIHMDTLKNVHKMITTKPSKPEAIEFGVRTKEKALEDFTLRLDFVKSEKTEMINRFDKQIKEFNSDIDRLKVEIKDDKKKLDGLAKFSAAVKKAAKKKAPKKKPPKKKGPTKKARKKKVLKKKAPAKKTTKKKASTKKAFTRKKVIKKKS
jgi:hypothetical protein